DDLITVNRLRQEVVDAAAFNFFGDEADTDEHGDEEPEDRRRRQAKVLDDLHVLAGRELSEGVRRADQEDGEQHEIVENLVAHRFAKDVDGDPGRRLHTRLPATSSCVDTCSTKKSSSVARIGLSDTSR